MNIPLSTSLVPVQTKRAVLAQISVCKGCCCGAVERGKAEVPVDWLKAEWKQRGLKKSIQLTITGCLGPCDVSNVVKIDSATGAGWYGALTHLRHYSTLLSWAEATAASGQVVELPQELVDLKFDPFQGFFRKA